MAASLRSTVLTHRARLVALLAFVGFVLLAEEVNEQGAIGYDAAVASWVHGLPIPQDAWQLLTTIGGIVLIPVGIALVAWLWLTHRPRTAVVFGIAMLASSLWANLVKVTIARQRPPGADATGFSFPSAHTLSSTVTYGLVVLLVWRSAWPRWARRASIAALVVLIALIGLSRVALGVHYPSDLVGGWLMGTAIVALAADLTSADEGHPADDARPA